MRPTRRALLSGLAGAASGLAVIPRAGAVPPGTTAFRGLYRPPGFPRLADHPLTEFLADAYHLDGSAYSVVQGAAGAPLFGFSLRGYPYRTQFAAFSPAVTAAGQGCGFNGSSQYVYTSIGAGTGPWRSSPAQQTMLVVAQVNAQQPAAQTLMGIEGHAVLRRASLQVAANSTNFALNWVTNNTTTGNFSQSVVLGEPFAAALTLDCNAGIASLFYGQAKSTISGPTKAVTQWDETNFGNSVVAGVNQNNYLAGVVLFGAAWNTVLPDSVVFDLLQDPFTFLVFPDDDLMAELVGATTVAHRIGAHGFPR